MENRKIGQEPGRLSYFDEFVERLNLSEQSINEIARATWRLREILDRRHPDYVLVTGGSRRIMKRFLEATADGHETFAFVEFPHWMNALIYKHDSQFELPDDVRLQLIQQRLSRGYPQLSPDHRIVLVEEYIKSGQKADAYIKRFQSLGFTQFSVVALFGAFLAKESDEKTVAVLDEAGSGGTLKPVVSELIHLSSAESHRLFPWKNDQGFSKEKLRKLDQKVNAYLDQIEQRITRTKVY